MQKWGSDTQPGTHITDGLFEACLILTEFKDCTHAFMHCIPAKQTYLCLRSQKVSDWDQVY